LRSPTAIDHVGGIEALSQRVGKKGIDLVLHSQAFRNPRYLKITDDFKVFFPSFTRKKTEAAGVHLVETEKPYPMIDGNLLFLGAIPRRTAFEKGALDLCYEEDGVEKQDPTDDDSALVFNVRNKGLVILSGCAHAGIVNTVAYAREVTGIHEIFAVMGGFHLTGADMNAVVAPTTQALKAMDPEYIIPTHCTGRAAAMHIEKEMPDKFLLNMSGTRMTFSG
jgi:7,8-dihydropterin-6-yl-methyl-4-(beta-D-ribofuranosyl)aminobenzene 5'-phosphate synthase